MLVHSTVHVHLTIERERDFVLVHSAEASKESQRNNSLHIESDIRTDPKLTSLMQPQPAHTDTHRLARQL